MTARIVSIVILALAVGLIWLGYDQRTELRRTWFWEFRFVLLAAFAFVVLTLAERLTRFVLSLIQKT